MSQAHGRLWEQEGALPWDAPDEEWEPAQDEDWRGTAHAEDWPVTLAGPEYWLWLAEAKREEGRGDGRAGGARG